MFFELRQTDFASYANDNKPYVEANDIDRVMILENDLVQCSKWSLQPDEGQ